MLSGWKRAWQGLKYFAGRGSTTVPTGEIGISGATSSIAFRTLYGLSDEEYHPDLNFPDDLAVYNRMRRNDGTVQALEMALTLPIRSTEWHIEEAGNGSTAREAAELVRENLLNHTTHTFDDFLRESLLALFYGFTPFEKVFEEHDGYIKWRKLASRHPATIKRFITDQHGGLQSLVQQVGGQDYIIPIEKLLVFIYRREFSNHRGLSILRAAYKHWKILDTFYLLQAIGFERWVAGVPHGTVPPGTPQSDRDAYLALLTKLRSSEYTALVTPSDYDLKLIGEDAARAVTNLNEPIQHHSTQIVKSALAQFLNLGTGNTGSWALSKDHSQLFMFSLNSTAAWIAEYIYRHAIRQLCHYNFGIDFSEYPKITYTDLRLIFMREEIASMVGSLIQQGVTTPDPELDNFVRGVLDLPRKLTTNPTSIRLNRNALNSVIFSNPASRWTTSRAKAELKFVQQSEDEFQASMRDHLQGVFDALNKRVQPLLKNNNTAKVAQITMPDHKLYADMVRDYMLGVFSAARDRLAEELNTKLPDTIPNTVRAWITAKAETIAKQHYANLLAQVQLQTLSAIRQNTKPEILTNNITNALNQRANAQFHDFVAAGQEMIEWINNALADGRT